MYLVKKSYKFHHVPAYCDSLMLLVKKYHSKDRVHFCRHIFFLLLCANEKPFHKSFYGLDVEICLTVLSFELLHKCEEI